MPFCARKQASCRAGLTPSRELQRGRALALRLRRRLRFSEPKSDPIAEFSPDLLNQPTLRSSASPATQQPQQDDASHGERDAAGLRNQRPRDVGVSQGTAVLKADAGDVGQLEIGGSHCVTICARMATGELIYIAVCLLVRMVISLGNMRGFPRHGYWSICCRNRSGRDCEYCGSIWYCACSDVLQQLALCRHPQAAHRG